MTFGYALATPFGFAVDIEEKMPGPFGPHERGLVLGADSRFTAIPSGAVDDRGAKLWIFGAGIAAVFAGNVALAERGLSATRRRLDESGEHSLDSVAECAHDGFLTAIPRAHRGGSDAVYCLLGVRLQNGEMSIVRLESSQDFAPELSLDTQFIGDVRAAGIFESIMLESVAPQGIELAEINGRDIIANVEQLHSSSAAALAQTIKRLGQTVGGPIQTVLLTPQGSETRTTHLGSFDQNDKLTFRKISASENDVHTHTGRDNRRLPPSSEDALAITRLDL